LTSIVDHPGASYGAAVIAGIGVGVIDDWSYVVGSLGAGDVISPIPAHVELYDERYLQFHQLHEATTSLAHSLARSSL
jgi:xylulokinase